MLNGGHPEQSEQEAEEKLTLSEAETRESVREALKELCEDVTLPGRLKDGRVSLAKVATHLRIQGIKIPGKLKKFLYSDPYFEVTASEHGDSYVQYLTEPKNDKPPMKLRPGDRAVLRPAPAGTRL